MKSGKQRRMEIMAKRHARIQQQAHVTVYALPRPANSVLADHAELTHNNSWGLPLFYEDRAFTCRDCGAAQIWTAKQQKWWYEINKGNIDSIAVRCRPCRKKEQDRKREARRVQQEGMHKKIQLALMQSQKKSVPTFY
ncbi:hypothetical protein BH11PSE11_BH11PSE11_07750 [soil metagenome]